MAVEAHHLGLSKSQPIPKPSLNAPFLAPQMAELLLSDQVNHPGSSDAQGTTSMLFMAPRKKQRVLGGRALAIPFVGEDLTMQLHLQQLEIDRVIDVHAGIMRTEVMERRKLISRQMLSAVEKAVANRMQSKEEEIFKIRKLNWELEQKIHGLCVENQIWRDLAESNEATANALRINLEQILAEQQFRADEYPRGYTAVVDDDAASCCGDNEQLIAASRRRCLSCRLREPAVLLLPCRHLSICEACEPTTTACPTCNCSKSSCLAVNMS